MRFSFLHFPSSALYWCLLPCVVMVVQCVAESVLEHHILYPYHAENGLHELTQFSLAVASFFFSLYVLLFARLNTPLLRAWFALAALGAFYLSGEEISWGQHFFDWETPEDWAAGNKQGETNLHNSSSWLNQKPRLILLLGILFSALVYPMLKKCGKMKLPDMLEQLLPAKELSIIAWIILVSLLVDKVADALSVKLFTRYSEVQETFIIYFIFLYLVMLQQKLRKEALR